MMNTLIQPTNPTTRKNTSPIILLHGFAASKSQWGAQIQELSKSNYETYALDLRGHGNSPKFDNRKNCDVNILFTQVASWIESLNIEKPITLIGHSLGAYLCLLYALDKPDIVNRLVLISPLYKTAQISTRMMWLLCRGKLTEQILSITPLVFIKQFLKNDKVNTYGLSPDELYQMAFDYKRADPKVIYLPLSITDLTPKLRSIHQGTLVIWGENDTVLDPISFSTLVQTLPEAIGISIPNEGHTPHLTNKKTINNLILEYLASSQNKI